MINVTLKRYWFVVDPEYRYGARNVGVTAASVQEARELIFKDFKRSKYEPFQKIVENADIKVIEDIDIRLLDKAMFYQI